MSLIHEHLDRMHAGLRRHQLGMFGLDRHPRAYERLFGWLEEPLHQRVAQDAATAGLVPGDHVLDIGTGPGRVPRLLSRLRPDLVVEGLDVSEQMIARAREAATSAAPPGTLRYTVGDVANLPHPDRSVALVVSSLSLHHWPDPDAGIAEVRRILAPDGRAWLYDAKPQLAATLRRLPADGITVEIQDLTPIPGRHGTLRDHLLRAGIARMEIR